MMSVATVTGKWWCVEQSMSVEVNTNKLLTEVLIKYRETILEFSSNNNLRKVKNYIYR